MYTQMQGKMKWTVLGRIMKRQERERKRKRERGAARGGSKAKIIKP